MVLVRTVGGDDVVLLPSWWIFLSDTSRGIMTLLTCVSSDLEPSSDDLPFLVLGAPLRCRAKSQGAIHASAMAVAMAPWISDGRNQRHRDT